MDQYLVNPTKPFELNEYLEVLTNIDNKLRGFQVLREYIHNNNYGPILMQKLYMDYDNPGKGILSIDTFRQAMRNFSTDQFFFSKLDIEDIILEAPKYNQKYILYEHLYRIIEKGREPTTSFSMVNQYCYKHFHMDESKLDDAKFHLENLQKNFFEQNDGTNFYKHDLGELQIDMLRDDWPEEQAKIEETEDEEIMRNPNSKAKIKEERNFRKSTFQNNHLILKNYPIKLSREIFQVTKKDSNYMQAQMSNQEIEQQIAFALKKKTQDISQEFLFQEDFQKYFQTDQCKQLKELNLTEDEDKIKKKTVQYEKVPRLFRELVKYAFQFGPSFMEQSLRPLEEASEERKNLFELSNLRHYFNSQNIHYEDKEINDLKLFLSQEGVVTVDPSVPRIQRQNSFGNYNCYIHIQKLMKLIEKQNEAIANQREEEKLIKATSVEQARHIIQASLIRGLTDRIKFRLRSFKDDNNMIDELKLRQVIADMFPELNQQNLDLIFDKLEHNTIPSKYMTQRKIYLPEFIGFMQSGIIFDPDFDEKSYKNFKNEKYNQKQTIVQKNENQKQVKDKLESQKNEYSDDDGESQQMQNSTSLNHRNQSSPTKNQNQQQQFIQQQNQKQSYLNNNYDFKRPDNKININNKNNQEKEKFVNPKQAGFVTKEPERAFTTINYNKNEIYSRFYQQIKDTLLPKKLLQYLTEKDLLQKSCLDLRKLFKKRDQGDGVLTLSDFREILEATFHQMNLNDINFLVSQALQKCAVGDIKDANQIAKDNLDYKFDKNQENQQGHIIKRVPENKNPRDPEISYSWFILNVQNELADILQITVNN